MKNSLEKDLVTKRAMRRLVMHLITYDQIVHTSDT